ncbi:hypothetical protein Gocc_2912 [Gaiella occulta]|uniref:Uncharacterized protein n=1 Tax=Gaiella occulta TaxID=1002870 RepID=A0A7M2YT28_9ACTN|nr:hypothetical protein [Gaiella occulta]RDI73312.1 hypothetical protein Gocc_2912 [Gaiella occulta]
MSELDLDTIAPDDRKLMITHAGRRFELPIRGSMPIPQMIRLLRLETRLNLAFAGDSDEALADVFQHVYDEIMSVVRERTPDCPDLEIDEQQALAILAFVAGDDTVAQAVTDAIAAPDLPAGERVARDAGEVAADGATPFASRTVSPTPSSGSDASTGGGPSGGGTSPGVPSDFTFETLTPV